MLWSATRPRSHATSIRHRRAAGDRRIANSSLPRRGSGSRGGFVGVDIFFVISGYLITGILVREMSADRFSVASFYRRRIVRIFPALIALLIGVTANWHVSPTGR
ncbi:acyltransferase family protein [Sphingomonas sp. MMS24-JH45]